jgi:hypothetical protein
MDTERLLQELNDLREATGTIQPRALWLRARAPKHWLHSSFEWDNGKAADKYRDIQAAQLIRIVKVERNDDVGIRELHPVRLEGGKRSYEPIDTVMKTSTLRAQMSERLQAEIAAAVNRWVPLGRKVGLDVAAIVTAAVRQVDDDRAA